MLGVAEWVVLGSWLGEPDVTSISTELSGLEGLSDVFLYDDGTTCSVDEPRSYNSELICALKIHRFDFHEPTLLHLREKVLVKQPTGLLVERAVDRDNIALRQHILEALNTTAADLLLSFGAEGLVIVVEELFAVEWLQPAEDTLADTADSNCSNDLSFKIELVLGYSSHVPFPCCHHLVCRDEVTDKGKDGHDNVLGDGDHVAASHLSDGNTAVGCVGSIEVDVVRSNTCCNSKLEVLGFGQSFCGKVTGVESGDALSELTDRFVMT